MNCPRAFLGFAQALASLLLLAAVAYLLADRFAFGDDDTAPLEATAEPADEGATAARDVDVEGER